jgi:hypothetical protein
MNLNNVKPAPTKSPIDVGPLSTIQTLKMKESADREEVKPIDTSDMMASYFMQKSEHKNYPKEDTSKLGEQTKKKQKLKYNVQPITDLEQINQLFSKNSGSAGFFTRVAYKPVSKGKTMIVPYCTPTMYYVCYKCGMATQDGRNIEDHLKNDLHTDNKKPKKYIKLGNNPSKKLPRLGWYKDERYLVIEECRYGFACVCGITSESIRSLQAHFKECTYSENTLPTVSSSCVDLDGILPLRSVNGKECNVKIDSYSCGFSRSVDNLMFCYNIPSLEMLTGQCQNTSQDRNRYKIINYCRRIDIILNKNWEEILKLVDSKTSNEKSNKSIDSKSGSDSSSQIDGYSDAERNQWGARSIQCERQEIGVTSEVVTDVDGTIIKTRGNECWKMIEKKYNIHVSWMVEIVRFAKSTAQADNTKNEYMSYDSFSLILTKSENTQQEHIDLLYPLSQFALTISNDVDTTIAYRVKKEVGKVNSMISFCTLLLSELSLIDKTAKFNELIRKIRNISPDSSAGKMIVKDGFGQLFQMRMKTNKTATNENLKFERAYIKHAPTATYTRIQGSVVHSGSGVAGRRVRCILFWSGKPVGDKEMYDPDVQQTMFSVMIEVIQEVWINNSNDMELRKEMVQLLYHVYQLCDSKYRKFGQSYPHLPNIEIMITEFGVSKSNKNLVRKMIKEIAKLNLYEKR